MNNFDLKRKKNSYYVDDILNLKIYNNRINFFTIEYLCLNPSLKENRINFY